MRAINVLALSSRRKRLQQSSAACAAWHTMPRTCKALLVYYDSTLCMYSRQVEGDDAALTPRVVLAAPPEGLRAAGLSERKVR